MKSVRAKIIAALISSPMCTIWSALVWRCQCRRECNRLRRTLQPLTWCRDSRFRCGWQRGRDARAQRRVQRAV